MNEDEIISTAMKALARKRLKDSTCQQCGATFTGREGKYCSKQCRNRAYVPTRRAQRAARTPAPATQP